MTPSDFHRQRCITFFGQFLSYFLLPFISPDWSLSQQIESLSAYAHLAAALHLKHGTACLTGALYADSQAVVKNIVFITARLQIMDGNLTFFIIQEGTDRLEGLFGDTRTQDHSRNFDIKQLCEKLSIATLIDGAFERNPELDRGHRRLSILGTLGIDHINPKSWKGDTHVGNVDLHIQWENGRQKAINLLRE
ncbi:hypothetical protein HYPSUDRAFT_150902, partial [Hypholoma sublateritium FD-334 SS-4]